VVLLGESPKLVYGIAGLMKDQEESLKEAITLLKAIGLSETRVRVKAIRIALLSITSFAFASFAGLLERSVLVEPFLNYFGLGYLLFTSVVNGDPPLASMAFMTLSILSYLFSYLGDALGRLLDPRTR